MNISFLLDLFDDLSRHTQLKLSSIAEDDPDDSYGLVMEEEREKMDEYIDDGKPPTGTIKPLTRADSRGEDDNHCITASANHHKIPMQSPPVFIFSFLL